MLYKKVYIITQAGYAVSGYIARALYMKFY